MSRVSLTLIDDFSDFSNILSAILSVFGFATFIECPRLSEKKQRCAYSEVKESIWMKVAKNVIVVDLRYNVAWRLGVNEGEED